ncbi:TraB/GumN family protein [Uliginosibacterium flavum]|uniref:TraB/GumN family protein n=1 Tax=Uliginosibacterium flavum TaxID=1396831 RepID=A0ABV2TME2_9RHOO
MLNSRKWLLLALCMWSTLAQAAGERLPLWEATNARGTVYLFGSIHVCNASCFPLPEAALRRLDASQTLVVELDPQRPEAQTKLMAAAMLPAGQRLSSRLSVADWRALQGAAAGLGLPGEALETMQPWMAGTVLSLLGAQQAGYEVSQGIDLALMQRARVQGLGLEELETIDTQITALSAGSEREQREALRLTIKQLQTGRVRPILDAMVRAWQTGDAVALSRLMREGMPSGSSLSRALIEDRNASMAATIAQSMQDGRTRFVVVGAAHLLGAEGIPALLGKRGYRVRQLDGQ